MTVRELGRQISQKIGEIVLVFRHEKRLRRTTDAKPGEFSERLVGQQPAAQFRQFRFQLGGDVGRTHSACSSPGSA